MIRLVRAILVIVILVGLVPVAQGIYYQAKAHTAQWLLEKAWRQSQQDHRGEHRPWPWADSWPVFKLTLIEKGRLPIVNETTLPRQGDGDIAKYSYIVLADASGESLAFAPGLMTPQIYPGDLGNSLIAAHRDTHFARLGTLQVKDLMRVDFKDGSRLEFTIDRLEIVNSETESPVLDLDEARLTLVTCYPFDAEIEQTPLRYLVSGKILATE
jgi:sortase A